MWKRWMVGFTMILWGTILGGHVVTGNRNARTRQLSQDEGRQLEVEYNNDKFAVEEEQVTENRRDVEDGAKEMVQEEESRGEKRMKFEEKQGDKKLLETPMCKCTGASSNHIRRAPRMIETGILSKIPPELLHHILKFLFSRILRVHWSISF